MLRLTLACLCLIMGISSYAQKNTFEGQKLKIDHPALHAQFTDYQVYEIDANAIHQSVQSDINNVHFELNLANDLVWDLQLVPNDIRSQYYQIDSPEKGTVDHSQQPVKTFQAYLASNPNDISAFTIDENFLYGYINQQDAAYFLEPLHYFIPGAAKNLFVVYNGQDVIDKENNTCAVTEMREQSHKHMPDESVIEEPKPDDPEKSVVACYEIEIAIASDWLMFNKYGSIVAVENHNIGVMNNVQTNYDNEFNHSYEFVIVTQFVSDCNTCDPWTASTDPGALLDDFRSWGQAGNFGVTFDIGSLWTDRNFQGSTIGLAWVGAVCTSFKYHVLEDFTSNANFLRVLTSHEIGHNCDALHDASGSNTIMAPSVSAATAWSAASISDIDSYMQTRINSGCLSVCGTSNPVPPVASFSANIQEGCAPLVVQFTDNSTGGTATSWLWDFPGGSPASSTDQNPVVTYTTAGTFDVTMEATNAGGSNSITEFDFITVDDVPVVDFDFFTLELEAFFTNLSSNANSYLWDFGDGNGSTDIDPTHTYDDDGVYIVTLEAFNDCGSEVYTQVIEVVSLPISFFTADVLIGCAPLTVQFEDLSSVNSTSWNWSFPGGDPISSTQQHPLVEYNIPGFYDVTLTVGNAAGTDTYTETMYIEVVAEPSSSFTFVVTQDSIVTFTNTSTEGDSYFWEFGDGTTSTEENPVHIYNASGDYDVSLTVTNFCDIVIFTTTVSIDIMTMPVAAFSASPTSGCEPMTVNFTDQSSGATAWSWSFPGGTPATSTDENPTIDYTTPGVYDVTLTVTNSFGNNTVTQTQYINVDPQPAAAYTAAVNLETITLTNTSTDANTYAWDFGDGNMSTDTDPMHTYAMDGTYDVQLIATNACGDDTTTQTIVIITPPAAGFSAPVTNGCADLTVNFSDQSSSNATAWAWSFPGGNPATSTDENPTVVYSTSGTYDVELIVSNAAGMDTLTQTAYVNINDVPNSGFTTSATDMTAMFNNTTTNGDTYAWDFGDGNMSTETNPTNVYAVDGTYTVQLIATNACGNDTTTQTVIISNLPQAGFGAPVTNGCAELTVNFTNQSSSNTTAWEWSFPGGNPTSSTAQNPTVVYTTAGTYDVTLIVTSTAGNDTLTQTAYVNVTDIPSAGFTNAVAGTMATFTNTSTDATTYTWDFGDGNMSTATDPTHDYAMDGTYTVELIATNACGNDTTTQTVVIVTVPSAGFTADVTSGCADLEVNFSDQSSVNATSWSWSFPGGNPSSSTEQNPTVTYTTAGNYDVTLTVSNAAGDDTQTITSYVSVDDVPDAGFTTSVNNSTATFTNTTTNGTTYSWDFGDSNTSSDVDPTHTYAADGTYTVTLVATNACGSNTTTETVVISNLPSAGFTADVTSGCAELVVNFSDQSSLNATSWSWSFPGGTPSSSDEQNPTVTYTTAGTYDVTLTVSNNAGDDTQTITSYVTVDDVPNADFTSNITDLTVAFNNTTTNGTTYAWDFGDGNESTDADPTHTYAMDGTYTVELVASNACGDDVVTQTVVVVTLPSAGFTSDMTAGCIDFVVNFMDQSSINATSWNWSFPGGIPATSTEQNPTVTYVTTGSFDVTLTVSNAAGDDTQTINSYIVVDDTPSAEFTSAVTGTMASFTNTSVNATSYSWDFGDGNGSADTNPTHTYAMDGTYTVILTATNACGSMTFTEIIEVATQPVAGFVADITVGCGPLTVNFTDLSSPNTTGWNWTFDGANPGSSSEQNPTIVFDAPGSYSVTLEASSPAGTSTFTEVAYITVLDVPSATFTSSVTGTVATFSNNTVGGDTYLWNFGDGNTSTDPNPMHDYLTDGVYTVTLMATNQCGTVTVTETVTIVTPPSAGFSADVVEGCAPLTVNFSDQSSANATEWNWTFTGGTPATSTEQNPVVVFNDPGTFGVSLEVSNAAGIDMTAQPAYIVVNTTPTASYTSSVSGATATFVNTSVNATTYSWDFGDGNSSTLADPTHSYIAAGTYTVVLTATNECGSVIFTETVTIISPPSVAFSANITSGCAPLTVNYSDQSTGNVLTWDWTFDGGSPATSDIQNPVVVYNTPGIYSVTLTATTAGGSGTFTQTAFISVLDVPTASFNANGAGADYTFDNTSTNATTYSWDFGDGNGSTMTSPTHTYMNDGTYTVTLTATNDCGSVTTTEEVTVLTAPVAGFTADALAGCAPLVVNFQNQSSANATNWMWTFTGGTPATSTDPNPTVTYNTPGDYPVTLTVSNAAGDNTLTQNSFITVTESAPLSGFDSTVSGLTVDFESTSTGATSYTWDFGDGNGSTMENPTHTYASDGTYIVTLIVTNGCGSSEITETVVIATPPVANFEASITSGCVPMEVTFTNLSSDNSVSWAWTFDGGTPATSTDENPTVTYNTAGVYDVTLVATNAQGEDIATQTSLIVVSDVPTADFSFSVDLFDVTFTNNSTGGTSYAWDFGDGNGSNLENPTYTYMNPGIYEVVLTVFNDCGSVLFTQFVEIEEGVAPIASFSSDMTTGCVPATINYTDESSDATSWAWTFEGGTPATSTEQNPAVVYNTPGVYEVSLTVSNPFGSNSITQVNYITIEDVPTASFTSDELDGTVTFTNSSVMASTYAWDFGDTETSSLENPIHVYAESGTYTVTLTVSNDCGSDTFTETITIMIDNIEDPASVSSINLYPNPNEGQFTLELEATPTDDIQVRFYNVIGQVVYADTYDFSSGNLVRTFDFSHFAAATYIMQLQMGNDIVYRKIVVE